MKQFEILNSKINLKKRLKKLSWKSLINEARYEENIKRSETDESVFFKDNVSEH